MLSKQQIQNIRSLHQKKYRQESGLFLVEGEKMTRELLNSSWEVKQVYGLEEWVPDYNTIPYTVISSTDLERISTLKTPNKVLAVAVEKEYSAKQVLDSDLVIYLDGIRDPGNLGTIFRVADWFGATLILSPDCVEVTNPKTVQSTMGSLFRVPYRVSVWESSLEDLNQRGFSTVTAELTGESLYTTELPAPLCIVMGSESHGVRKELSDRISRKITIPGSGQAESLNVAVATSLFCSEYRRR